jgi:hypothetical protein
MASLFFLRNVKSRFISMMKRLFEFFDEFRGCQSQLLFFILFKGG